MEHNGVWSEDIKIRAFMVDRNREANVVAIQNMCQEVASNHANFRGLGFEGMQARGLAWVLNRLKIKVFEFPKWTETVTVKTWVSQMQPFSHRHFQIVLPDTEGVILANIYTIWIPIDVVSKRPKRVFDFDMPLYDVVYDCGIPEKLNFTVEERNPDDGGKGDIFSSERQVQYADLDMLGHVNNAKYVEWLLDDFYKNNKEGKPNSLEINYLGEVFEDATVQIFAQKGENEICYTVKNREGGREVIRAKLSLILRGAEF